MRRWSLWALVAAWTVVMGCDPEVPYRSAGPERVEAVFDPDTGEIPLPNDAAMNDGRLPPIPGASPQTAAGELSDYMTALRGWPRTTPISIPFTGPLDEDSLFEEPVRLYRVGDDEQLQRLGIEQVHYSEDQHSGRSSLEVVPARAPEPGAEYAVVITDDLRGANGEPTLGPVPIYLASLQEPLVDDDDQPTLELLADDPESARSLENMRRMLEPVFAQLETGIENQEPVERHQVVMAFRWTSMPEKTLAFHPGLGELPLPNTAALDDDGTFPAAGVCDLGEESAQGQFDEYLTGLLGWPTATPLTIAVTQPIDAEALGDDDIQVWRDDGDGWQRIEPTTVSYRDRDIDPCTGEESEAHILDIELGEPMETHHDYFAFVRRDLHGHSDELVPEMPMWLAIQPYDLVDDQGASTISALDDQTAKTLQAIRDELQGPIELIEDQTGLDHHELAGVFGWSTWSDAFAVFDPDGAIPIPNAALMDDDGTVEIPIEPGAAQAMTDLLESLNRRSGFSTTAPGWIPTSGALDADSVDFDSFRLVDMSQLALVDGDSARLEYRAELNRITFEPVTQWSAGSQHIGALTDQAVGENGRPVQPTPAFVFLRSQYPVYDDDTGQSLVGALDDDQAQTLEGARQLYNGLLTLAEPMMDRDRSQMVAAWAFDTDDPVEFLRQFRALAIDALDDRQTVRLRRRCEVESGCSADPDLVMIGDQFEHPNQPGVMVATEHVGAAHFGAQFQSVEVDVENHSVSEAGDQVGATVYLPKSNQDDGMCHRPYDAVIAQHGLRADRWRSGLAMANEMAAFPRCMATVAIDLPGHGGRTPGQPSLHPTSTPSNSGAQFLSDDLVASKANFAQGVVDLFVLVQAIDDDGLEGLFAGLDGSAGPYIRQELGFVGTSLGGMVGTPFAALEPAVDTVALSASGGRLSWIVQGDEQGPSVIGAPLLDVLADELGIEEGDETFFEAMAFVQWLADVIDPIVFANTATTGQHQTLDYDPVQQEFVDSGQMVGPVSFLLQMVDGDRVMVNRSTRVLARALGLSLEETTFFDVPHSFASIVDTSDPKYDQGLCARRQMASWLRRGSQGNATWPPQITAQSCANQ